VGRLFAWFVDDDDVFWSPWRGVLLWLLVVAVLALIGWGVASAGDSSNGPCPPSWQGAGDC
jgi:hypothetical protein